MSVQSEIDRIKKNVNDTLKTISDTGVTVGAGSDSLPAAAAALANEKQDKLTGTQGQVVGFDSGGNAVPQDAPKKPKSTLVTLPLSAWSNNTQTVTVQGVLADESKQLIQPMPTIADQNVYSAAGISCTGQAANKLTFKAQTVPTEDIQMYVVVQEVGG